MKNNPSRSTCWLVLFAFLIAAPGCGGKNGGGESDGDTDSSDGPVGDECRFSTDCPSGFVCNPTTGYCIPEGSPCETHMDCGEGEICGPDGSCAANVSGGPCEDDKNCVGGEICSAGICGCGGELYQAERVPANMLIVLDRSTSMRDEIGGAGTKWEIAHEAIAGMLDAYAGQIRFGLMLYPGLDQACDEGEECGPGAVFVDVGSDTADAIRDFLAGADTCSFGTPTAEALEVLVDYEGLQDPDRANTILLITDGQSTCDDPVPRVTDLRNESPGIQTFVVGFGSSVDPEELADMAEAGGTARAEDPPYYQADDDASLMEALMSIGGGVLSCSFELSSVPPDEELLFIYFDEREIARDTTHANGWDYDPDTNQITFYGEACDDLQAGRVGDLVVSYGCPLII
jgi:hypothetical protein